MLALRSPHPKLVDVALSVWSRGPFAGGEFAALFCCLGDHDSVTVAARLILEPEVAVAVLAIQ